MGDVETQTRGRAGAGEWGQWGDGDIGQSPFLRLRGCLGVVLVRPQEAWCERESDSIKGEGQ
jgi:hypothetical protein